MKITKDHDNFDYLSVSLKSEHADMLMKCYRALGWKAAHTEDDKDYADMKYVLFSRPHNVPNKDRLQYIQVRMESLLNASSERIIKRHRKSIALAVSFVIFGLLFAAGGLCLALILPRLAVHICGWVCVGLGGVLSLGTIYPLTKVRKDENKRLKTELEENFAQFEKFVREAAELSSVQVDFEEPEAAVAFAEEVE